MSDQKLKALEDELLSMGKTRQEIRPFIDLMANWLKMSEHSQPLNVSRNVPLGKDDKIRLNNISKSTGKLLKDMRPALESSEFRSRLQISGDELSELQRLLTKLEGSADEAIQVQSATTTAPERAGHLRPEYRGTRITPHEDIERLVLLQAALDAHFPEIQARENQTIADAFLRLAGILLDKKDPRRSINKYLEIRRTPYDV